MDMMQAPIVKELSRMSPHPAPDLPAAGLRGPQTWRAVRAARRARIAREPGRRAAARIFIGGRY
jgi:hypothetical protein